MAKKPAPSRRPNPKKTTEPKRTSRPTAEASKPRRGLVRRLVRRLLGLVPGLVVGLLVLWVGLFLVYAPELPDTEALFADARQAKVTLIAADGSLIAERGTSGRAYVRLGEISDHVIEAVIATEDRRFYSHFGLDLIGTARAALENITAGGYVAGGSTITQQLAKNLYLTPERSIRRKLEELILALWLEARLTKDEILEIYLNRVYFGAGAYGVEAAARRYFGKPASRLALNESAMLAGLLWAPSRYAPTNDLDRAQARAATVLRLMAEAGYITERQAAGAQADPATLAAGGSGHAGHFTDYVLDGLTEHLGKPERGWVVRTTLDPALQRRAEAALHRHLQGHPGVEGAIVVLDGEGAIRAMVGGRDYRRNGFNRAAFAERQPGSAFKPFVFIEALEQGMSPGDIIEDGAIEVEGWRPRNPGDRHYGRISLEEALALSVNTVAVRLLEEVGRDDVVATAQKLGITSELRPVPSLALGTSEVTPLELTAAYQPFATQGVRRPPYAVARVADRSADILFQHRATEAQVIDPGHARAMRRMLRAVVTRGTGQAAALEGREAFGKTGTSQGARDAWFVGFSGSHIAGVWVGRDDNGPMPGVNGANLPARIWADVMEGTAPADAMIAALRPKPRPERGGVIDRARDYVLDDIIDWVERVFNR